MESLIRFLSQYVARAERERDALREAPVLSAFDRGMSPGHIDWSVSPRDEASYPLPIAACLPCPALEADEALLRESYPLPIAACLPGLKTVYNDGQPESYPLPIAACLPGVALHSARHRARSGVLSASHRGMSPRPYAEIKLSASSGRLSYPLPIAACLPGAPV